MMYLFTFFSAHVDNLIKELKVKVVAILGEVAQDCRQLFRDHKINTDLLHGGRKQYLQPCYIRVSRHSKRTNDVLLYCSNYYFTGGGSVE